MVGLNTCVMGGPVVATKILVGGGIGLVATKVKIGSFTTMVDEG